MKLLLLPVAIQLIALPPTIAYGEVAAESDPLYVSPFVPPVPKEPKEMPAISVMDSVESRMGNQMQLRIVRAEPSELPDLASIREDLRQKSEVTESAADRSSEVAATEHRSIVLGATVIDREISHVTWTDSDGKRMEALCGFDISLLEGLPGFSLVETTYSLMLFHGHHVRARDGKFRIAAFPQLRVKSGEIVLPVAAAAEGMEVPEELRIIARLISLEGERLAKFQQDRAARQEAERQWKEANPEPPRDESIWLRPHSGSRYLDTVEETTVTDSNEKGGTE